MFTITVKVVLDAETKALLTDLRDLLLPALQAKIDANTLQVEEATARLWASQQRLEQANSSE